MVDPIVNLIEAAILIGVISIIMGGLASAKNRSFIKWGLSTFLMTMAFLQVFPPESLKGLFAVPGVIFVMLLFVGESSAKQEVGKKE
jgi:pyruvate carboxylase